MRNILSDTDNDNDRLTLKEKVTVTPTKTLTLILRLRLILTVMEMFTGTLYRDSDFESDIYIDRDRISVRGSY